MTNIETAVLEFAHRLRALGLNEETGALLIQVKINGECYIRSIGNLDHLISPAIVIEEVKDNLIVFILREIELSANAASTIKLHRDTVRLLEGYTPNVLLQDITSTYLQQLELYMRKEKRLAINTIARHMKVLKKYINIAIKKERISKYPFANYIIRTEQTEKISLTEKELELLEEYRKRLKEPDETLNAFLFSCYTGLRYSDVCEFTKQKIVANNRKKWIILKTHKNKIEVRIPISTIFEGKALLITKSIPRTRGLLFPLSSNQQTSRDLRRIMRATGIKKRITFHTGRHTCATLLMHRGVSITTVQKILGHKSIKTTEIYSAVTDLTLEKELKKSNKKKGKK